MRHFFLLIKHEFRILFARRARVFGIFSFQILLFFGSLALVASLAGPSYSSMTENSITIQIVDLSKTNASEDLLLALNNDFSEDYDLEIIDSNELDDVLFTNITEESSFNLLLVIPDTYEYSQLQSTSQNFSIWYSNRQQIYSEIASLLNEFLSDNLPEQIASYNNIKLGEVNSTETRIATTGGLPVEFAILAFFLLLFIVFSKIAIPLNFSLLAISKERQQNTLELLFLQPISRRTIVFAKISFTFLLLSLYFLIDFCIITFNLMFYYLLTGNSIFDILDRVNSYFGSPPSLLFFVAIFTGILVTCLFLLTLGFLISFFIKDEREASTANGLVFIFLLGSTFFMSAISLSELPIVLQYSFSIIPLSGFFFSTLIALNTGSFTVGVFLSSIVQMGWICVFLFFITRIAQVDGILDFRLGNFLQVISRRK